MNSAPEVRDIQTYLRDNGWQRQPQTWNGASIWSHTDGYEVLVPPRDDLADTELRVREILTALTTVEGRAAGEIADDINTPFDDIQLYRTFPDGMSEGFISLTAGLRGLQSVRDMISAAARVVVEGPLPVFPRGTPLAVTELLQHVRLGPSHPEGHAFTVRVPLTVPSTSPQDGTPQAPADTPPFGRQVVQQLYTAVVAVHSAAARATEPELAAFDEAVAFGGSANLCEALSGLAGRQYQQPFEVTFRWGRGLKADIPTKTLHFAHSAGAIIRDAATHLRQRGVSGASTVTGLVASLHGQTQSTDHWRIKVRGSVTRLNDGESIRTIWVRLDSRIAYDQAIIAHRSKKRVRARGELSVSTGQAELTVDGETFEILD